MEQRPNNPSLSAPANNEQQTSDVLEKTREKLKRRNIIKNKIALWVLGLNTAICSAIICTAAKDIIHATTPEANYILNSRKCRVVSTGLIILLVKLPALLVSLLQDCIWRSVRYFVPFSFVLSGIGCIFLAIEHQPYLSFTGIILISLACGISDYQLRKQVTLYKTKVSKCFQSGTLEALLLGPAFYTLLRGLGVSMFYCFITLPIVPALAVIFFWTVLKPPPAPPLDVRDDSALAITIFVESKLKTYSDKFQYNVHLIKLFFPLGVIMLCDGLINHGAYEFIYYNGLFMDHFLQYRLFVCLYFLGFYVCSVVGYLLMVHFVWICTVIHLFMVAFAILTALYHFLPFMWITVLVAYLQGINSGIAHTSTTHRIQVEEPWKDLFLANKVMRNFNLLMLAFGGVASFGLHHFISRTSEP